MNYKPYYDQTEKTWKVDFPNRPSEEGSLFYVACEFAHTSLYYPFNDSQTQGKPYPGHGHAFEDVIRALMRDPQGFSIRGFEEHYSQQEIELLGTVKEKLLEIDVQA